MTLFDGITARRITTSRLTAGVLERDGDDRGVGDDRTIVFVHGSVASAEFWQKTMLALPKDLRLIAVDLRGFGRSDALPVDATRGVADFADDLHAVLAALEISSAHLVGWALGGGVVMQYALQHPVRSLTLESPVSPYGFGGTRRDGSLLTADAALAGAGAVDADFLARLRDEDESTDAETSPRSVFRTAYIAPGYISRNEDVWVDAMLTTVVGDDNYPGTSVPSENWPGFAPGATGVLNAIAPTNFDVSGLTQLAEKPPILWVHGDRDVIISDSSLFETNHRGATGAIANWPGADLAPAQPMVTQTRDVLDAYAAGGGHVVELALPGVGHAPHLEEPEDFRAALLRRIDYVPPMGPPTEVIVLKSAD
ncbi:alpha/beta fold hydrolase [Microbacterium gorillae]|uniref:alpha/beta fold hydrolase n=1 Tax=Microbacterium gorillae TaxID=1231063 RepID=UPI00058F5D1D|nr:alpha/beta hydrolase [Microbacterium gorillae]